MRKYYLYAAVLLIVVFVVSCSGGGGGTVIPTGSATLSWTAPAQNNDGTTPVDLAGFKVHYGTSTGNYTHTINIARPAATSYTVTGLPLGATYYFVVTAYNSAGAESAPSGEELKKL